MWSTLLVMEQIDKCLAKPDKRRIVMITLVPIDPDVEGRDIEGGEEIAFPLQPLPSDQRRRREGDRDGPPVIGEMPEARRRSRSECRRCSFGRHAIGKTIAGGDPYAQELLKHGLLRGGKGSKVYVLTPEGRAIAEILIANQS
jgi:hypothetical protein